VLAVVRAVELALPAPPALFELSDPQPTIRPATTNSPKRRQACFMMAAM
jgi:hypothetical protein